MRTGGRKAHDWTRDDEVVAAGTYLLQGGYRQPADVVQRLSTLIGCSEASVIMKLGNVDAWLGHGNFTGGSELMKQVCDKLAALPRGELRAEFDAAVGRLRAAAAERAGERARALPELTDEQRVRIAARRAERRRDIGN